MVPCHAFYQHLSTLKSPALRKKLVDNQKTFEQRYSDNTTSPPEASAGLPGSLAWNLDAKEGETLFRERGFYSLIRMLALAVSIRDTDFYCEF